MRRSPNILLDADALDYLSGAVHDSFDPQDWYGSEPEPPDPEQLERLCWALQRISVRYLCAIAPDLLQTEMAPLLEISQPSVSYRRSRALAVLHGLVHYPGNPDEDFVVALDFLSKHLREQSELTKQPTPPYWRDLLRIYLATGRRQTLPGQGMPVSQSSGNGFLHRLMARVRGESAALDRLLTWHNEYHRQGVIRSWVGPDSNHWREYDRQAHTQAECQLADEVLAMFERALLRRQVR